VEPIQIFERAVDQTGRIVNKITADQFGLSTPCDEWDVRGLLNHTIAAVGMFDRAARGQKFDPAPFAVDNVGSDPQAAYQTQAGSLRAALSQPGVLESTWSMPFGDVPGMMAIGFATLETLQHGWDLARATSQDADFDASVTEAAFATARMAPSEQVRVPGVFGPEAPCSKEAPAHDQLAAFLGRRV
jgi:uncharacterized protein (TIGR03086 family)